MSNFTASDRKTLANRGEAMKSGSFPIRNKTDLANAIRAVGRAKGDRDAVRRFIIKRARALGAQYPDSWNSDGSLKN